MPLIHSKHHINSRISCLRWCVSWRALELRFEEPLTTVCQLGIVSCRKHVVPSLSMLYLQENQVCAAKSRSAADMLSGVLQEEHTRQVLCASSFMGPPIGHHGSARTLKHPFSLQPILQRVLHLSFNATCVCHCVKSRGQDNSAGRHA